MCMWIVEAVSVYYFNLIAQFMNSFHNIGYDRNIPKAGIGGFIFNIKFVSNATSVLYDLQCVNAKRIQ